MKHRYLIITITILALGLVLGACASAPEPTPCPDCPEVVCPEPEACPECPEPPPCPEPVVKDVPFQELWVESGHADSEAEAFNHWNEDDPAEVSTRCAKCHSTYGYLDFLGEDGTEAGTVDNAAEIGSVVTCAACHNESAASMTSVVFPSGVEITGLGSEARCMQCHQGRASAASVNGDLEELGLTEDLDTPNEELGFINMHYFAAGATMYGSEVQGGYEYAGKSYDVKFAHVDGYDTCVDCHNTHSLEVKVAECTTCHTDVSSQEDLVNIRMKGSLADFDGDGDVSEGVYFEIEGLQAMLYQAIQAYGSEVAGSAIVYDSHAYPYFFIDTNEDGEPDEDEAQYANQYASWTGRLVQATFNYQVSMKDPGAFAHGGKYIIQLLYDSIEDLNTVISSPVDLSAAHRLDPGHFAGSQEAFRHWDEDGEVRSSCAKCHSAGGIPTLLKEGVNISEPLANGLMCSTCHDDVSTFTRYVVDSVEFTSGASLTFGEGSDANICLNCHQGRQSKSSVDSHIAGSGAADDEVSEDLSFRNPHYFAAGATLFGSDATGAYEYDGQTYLGPFAHAGGFDNCIACHDTHALEVKVEACSACHSGVESEEDLEAIRMSAGDFDGDGDEAEGMAEELATMTDALYTEIQAYAADQIGTAIVYDSHAYPYFFIDTNGNGEPDGEEASYGNKYATWTPKLLRAAYNYQWINKDPGAFAHNGKYMVQVLYDSLMDLGADVSAMTRP